MRFLNWPLFILLLTFTGLAHADYGCHFVINSRLATSLDGPGKKLSFRFTAKQDMGLIGLSFYCEQAQEPPEYKVSLQEDVKGLPSGSILESSSVTPKENCWVTIPINNLPLLAGKIYHMVIEQDITRGGQHPVGIIDSRHFVLHGLRRPSQRF